MIEEIARIFDALKNPKRILILRLIGQGQNPNSIAEQCGLSRGGLQRHIDSLMRERIIVHGVTQAYEISEKGRVALDLISKASDYVNQIKNRQRATVVKEAIEGLKSRKLSSVSLTDLDRILAETQPSDSK